MAHRIRWSHRTWFSVAMGGLCLATVAWAGTTGKIAGTVRGVDGTPIPGVAVQIPGLRLGSVSDANGLYFILQVPPGEYQLQAAMVGYRTTITTGVVVNLDRTTTIDFTLQEEAIEIAPVVVTAGRPPIEADVTSSQTRVDAKRVAELPVSTMLAVLNYEPGVSAAENDLNIRGGGPSEIRFQVNGLDRTDAITGRGYTQLNQVLVSEVTLLTGGFNAEYGNVRSGMVNVATKEGTERGFGLPWVSAVYSTTPGVKKHRGPSAYGEDQYDYWVALQSDSTNDYGPVYWPDLYEETRNDTALQALKQQAPTIFRVFDGWASRVTRANFLNLGKGAYGKNDWTAEQVREAWQWEANMNEQVWQYGNKPDWALDVGTGLALPKKLGGVTFGFTQKRVMTTYPALRPYALDRQYEAGLTLTPIDPLKLRFSYTWATNSSTGASYTSGDPELAATNASGQIGGDPMPLRSSGSGAGGGKGSEDNKLSLSFDNLLDQKFSQWGASLTYTFSPSTFLTASFARSSSEWELKRDLPRANVNASYDPNDPQSQYKPPSSFGYRGWLGMFYYWSDTGGTAGQDLPKSLEDALDPDRVLLNGPYGFPNYSRTIPSEGKYITKTFFADSPKPATVVSPQGYVVDGYEDLSGTYRLGGGGTSVVNGHGTRMIVKADLTHAVSEHTFKTGVEYIRNDLEYHAEESSGLVVPGAYSNYRDYGGNWPTPRPSVLGIYLQDKYESHGMIANLGVRLERFDGNFPQYLQNDLFNEVIPIPSNGKAIFDSIAIARGWDLANWGPVGDYYAVRDSLAKHNLGEAPMPWDVFRAIPHGPNKVYWRFGPRFGISHPVTERTKFFFNYGQFYSMQKPAVMFGIGVHDRRIGSNGRMEQLYNPSLRPAKTTMYEVGVEHVLLRRTVLTIRGYTKYNVDQVSRPTTEATGTTFGYVGYSIYRNSNYEDIRGLEIKLSAAIGRFVSGWATYERYATRTGEVGLTRVNKDPVASLYYTPYVRTNQPLSSVRGLLRFSTPPTWGALYGGWGLSVVQAWSQGSEVIYQPDPTIPIRELPKEYFLRNVDYWNTDLKFDKTLTLPGGRRLSAYVDITNVLNTKRLNGGGLYSYNDYLRYIVDQRAQGKDLRVGDESTFYVFTRPYKDAAGNWKAPLSPRTEWMQHINPRAFRFGVRFDL